MANPTETVAEKIPLESVHSSNIAAVGYDAHKSILAVRFKSGAIFHYAGVSLETMTEFYAAESKGRFFGTQIRGKYAGMKMTGRCGACGHEHGWIGDVCSECGDATYEAEPRRSER